MKGVWLAPASGHTSTSGFAPMDQLASPGDMESMLKTILLIIMTLAFGGVVERVGVRDQLITPIIIIAFAYLDIRMIPSDAPASPTDA